VYRLPTKNPPPVQAHVNVRMIMKDYAEESLSRIQLDVQDGRNKEKSDSPVKYIANLENGQKC